MKAENKAKTRDAHVVTTRRPQRNPSLSKLGRAAAVQPCGFSRDEMRRIVLEMIG